jgi:hypothetical protein
MKIFQDDVINVLHITDQFDGWFQARSTASGDADPVAILINANHIIVENFVTRWNSHMGWDGDLTKPAPAGCISEVEPLSLFELGRRLLLGVDYRYVYGEIGPKGRPYSRQGFTEGMRQFLLTAALS